MPWKTGGRRKGTPNKVHVTLEPGELEAVRAGLLPLPHMLEVMNDERADPHRRDFMAKAAAPYCHRRLKAVEHSGEGSDAVGVRAEWLDKPQDC